MEILEEKIVPATFARKILDAKAKEQELSYEQRNAYEFLHKFCKLTEKKAAELAKELQEIGKLKEKHIIAIIDFLPRNEEELKVLFAQENVNLSEDERKKVLKIVENYI